MPLTGNVVRDALAAAGAVGRQLRTFDELAAGASAALRQAPAGLTAAGAAAFLATTGVESAWFRTTVEYGTTLRYDPFRGRTFVQLTWEPNYRGFGEWCHARGLVAAPDTFVRNPSSLGAYDYAWLGAVYYFEANRLWAWANAGDFLRVSQAVNGGRSRAGTAFVPNGWGDRQALHKVFLRAGNDLLPTPTAGRPAAPVPDQEDDDMTPEQSAVLGQILTELVGPDRARWGWDTWDGGSTRADGARDRFTALDYLRKANQRDEDVMRELTAVRDELAAVRAAPSAGGGLTADDVRQILREALADAGPLYLTTKETPR